MAKRLKTVTDNGSIPAIPEGFTERQGDFPKTWEPTIGEFMHGQIVDFKTDVKTKTKKGKSDAAIVQDSVSGMRFTVWISAGLVGRIGAEDVGGEIWICRLADTKSKRGHNPMKTFRVAIKPPLASVSRVKRKSSRAQA